MKEPAVSMSMVRARLLDPKRASGGVRPPDIVEDG